MHTSNGNGHREFLAGLIAGLVLGAGAGYLLTPREGALPVTRDVPVSGDPAGQAEAGLDAMDAAVSPPYRPASNPSAMDDRNAPIAEGDAWSVGQGPVV